MTSVRSPRGNAEAHYLLAGYYQERGRHREAVAELDKAIKIDPLHVKAYNSLGISWSALGDHAKAMRAYETALRLNPELDYLHNNLGYAHLLQGNTDEAIKEFQKAVALNSRTSRAHNNLGIAYLRKGEADKARDELALGKGDAWAFYHLAQMCYQQDRFSEASSNFARALEVNPCLVQARKGLEASQTLAIVKRALTDKGPCKTDGLTASPAGDARGNAPLDMHQEKALKGSDGHLYIVRKGDRLVKILRTVYRLTDKQIYHQYLAAIQKLNPEIKNPNMVYPGQRIRIPSEALPVLSRRQEQPQGLRTAGLPPRKVRS